MRITPSQYRAAKTKATLIGFILGMIAGWFATVLGMIHHGAL